LKNSNGLAAHFDLSQATENALCELIERDVFLCNYLCVKAGVREVDKNLLPDSFLTTVKEFENKNIHISFYELGTLLNRTVILAITNGFNRINPFGCVIGLGASLTKEKAIAVAFSEAARNTVTYIDRNNCIEWHKSENDFFNEDIQTFSILEHGKLALSETYGRWLWNYFLEKKNYKILDHDIQENEIEIRVLDLDYAFSELGIKVVQARSKNMQNLFFHKTIPEKVNLARLERFTKTSLLFKDLNLRIHPIA
jgi:ribosomal protein S12 methylthiotransferase accessory factor YcaO